MTHICVSKLTTIGSDNGLLPDRRQAIIWTNAGILLIGPLGTNFCEISIGIQTFSFKKMHLKMSSAKCCPFCLGLNVLTEDETKKQDCKWHNIKWRGIVDEDTRECYMKHTVLTHWGRDKMDVILQTTVSNAFSWMKICSFGLIFHWSLFLRFQLTIFQHWFR